MALPTEPVQVLLISGPAGIGKSTLGWAAAWQVIERTGWAGRAARSRDGPAATETS